MNHMHARGIPAPLLIPTGLTIAGLAALALSVGDDDGALLVVGWLIAATTVAGIWVYLNARTPRIMLAGVVAVAAVAMTWEGGLFMLPGALALLAVSAITVPSQT